MAAGAGGGTECSARWACAGSWSGRACSAKSMAGWEREGRAGMWRGGEMRAGDGERDVDGRTVKKEGGDGRAEGMKIVL